MQECRLCSLPERCEVDTLEPRRRGTMPRSSLPDCHLDILSSKLAWLESFRPTVMTQNDTNTQWFVWNTELKWNTNGMILVCLWFYKYDVQSIRFCYSITSTWMFLQNSHLSMFKPPWFLWTISNRWRIAKPLEWIDRITFSKVFPSSWQRCHTWLCHQSIRACHDIEIRWNKEISETWNTAWTRVYSCFKVLQGIIDQFWILVTLHSISVLNILLLDFPPAAASPDLIAGSLSGLGCPMALSTNTMVPMILVLLIPDLVCNLMFKVFLGESMFGGSGPQMFRVAPQCPPTLVLSNYKSISAEYVMSPSSEARSTWVSLQHTWKMAKLDIILLRNSS